MPLQGYAQRKGTINTESKKFARDTIIWHKDSLLTADNFQSKGKKDAVAFTASAIFFHTAPYDPSLFYVEAIFMKSKSYIKENRPYVLKHVAAYEYLTLQSWYARKLRQMLRETDFKKVKNISAEIQKLYNKVLSEENKEQNNYDKDTEHGSQRRQAKGLVR